MLDDIVGKIAKLIYHLHELEGYNDESTLQEAQIVIALLDERVDLVEYFSRHIPKRKATKAKAEAEDVRLDLLTYYASRLANPAAEAKDLKLLNQGFPAAFAITDEAVQLHGKELLRTKICRELTTPVIAKVSEYF